MEVYTFAGPSEVVREIFLPLMPPASTLVVSLDEGGINPGSRIAAAISILATARDLGRVVFIDLKHEKELSWAKTVGKTIFVSSSDRGAEFPLDAWDWIVPADDPVPVVKSIVASLELPEPRVIFCAVDDTILDTRVAYEAAVSEARDYICLRHGFVSSEFNPLQGRSLPKKNFPSLLVASYRFAVNKDQHDPVVIETIRSLAEEAVRAPPVWTQPTVPEALKELKRHGRLVLVTTGCRLDEVARILTAGIRDVDIEVVPAKTTEIFRLLQEKYPARHYTSIGSCDVQDIIPALNAGVGRAVYLVPPDTSIPYDSRVVPTSSFDKEIVKLI